MTTQSPNKTAPPNSSLFRSKKFIKIQHSKTRTNVFSSQEFAFSIPEVLEHILSFLSLQTRQNSARMVCKQWYAVCKDLIPTTHTWILRLTPNGTTNDNRDDDLTIRDQISSANNINLQISEGNNITTLAPQQRLISWAAMMDTLSSIFHEHSHRQLRSKLRRLHLQEGVLGDFATQLPQLPHLATLTILRIDTVAKWDIVHLFTIYKTCPNLEELSVKPTRTAECASPRSFYAMDQLPLASSQEHTLIKGYDSLPVLARLLKCSLYDVTVSLPALRVFLKASPRLSKLVLARCTHVVRQGQDNTFFDPSYGHNHQGLGIIRLVGVHCPNLENFHLSISSTTGFGLESQEVVSTLETFPHIGACNLTDERFNSVLLKSLNAAGLINQITTLNLLPTRSNACQAQAIPLRQILCSFKHLIHLRAPTAVYYLEDMDLHDVLGQLRELAPNKSPDFADRHYHIPTDDLAIAHQYIWVCRGLKTLHMALSHRASRSSYSAESSLIIFGFLSRMTPRLQELHLTRYTVNLSFQGGLSLLTRLQDLERIRIVLDHCPCWAESALAWLEPTPPSALDRLKYSGLHRRKMRKDLWRHYKGISSPAVTATGSMLVARGRELGMDLSKVGYPDDILEWMDERYKGKGISTTGAPSCRKKRDSSLSKLQSFQVETPQGRKSESLEKAEKYVGRVRPDVDVRLCRPRDDEYYLTTLKLY
ncbi:hypothetical protein BGZ96_004524 [Linnemannia gamsii]|uniref:F-box domain-containing protein n=1 Tax=Linnemannia gamsii TaxID=64522 RepID=A0ABQ7K6F5_9FUNG|nr:hypothetical protein BGZ96_004524 [Linnemannia gamsii]